jgi:hypothetical protein
MIKTDMVGNNAVQFYQSRTRRMMRKPIAKMMSDVAQWSWMESGGTTADSKPKIQCTAL